MQKVVSTPSRAGYKVGTRLGSLFRRPYHVLMAALIVLGFFVAFMDPRGLVVMVAFILPLVAVLRLLYGIRSELREHTKHLKATADLSYLLAQRDLQGDKE